MIKCLSRLFQTLHENHKALEISKEIYDHFQDVLPPLDIGLNYFVFQEGINGDRLLFSRIGNRYYCTPEKLNVCSEDWIFFGCLKRYSDGFKVDDLYNIDEELTNKQSGLIGLVVPSASALAEKLGVNFRV
jgi:hypothetical protein